MEKHGLSDDRIQRVRELIRDRLGDPQLAASRTALERLLVGSVPILDEGGDNERTLEQVVPKLLSVTRDPEEIVSSLMVGAVCSGGVDEYPAWLECSEPGVTARHRDREGLYPVPSIQTPSHARLAYARLGGHNEEGAATRMRGHASTLSAKGYPQPAERFGIKA